MLVSFLLSWGFIRTSAHMIRAQVELGPGNVGDQGRTHIHHLVWGILLLIVAGYMGIALDRTLGRDKVVAVLFGVGMGLTLDEFALWLNLEDVYWAPKGRESIDAVVLTITLLTGTLLGASRSGSRPSTPGSYFLGDRRPRAPVEAEESRSTC